MKKSFTVVYERVDPEPGFDGIAALVNNTTVQSGVQVAVTDVRVYVPTAYTSDQTNLLGNQGILSLDRISASTGGVAATPSKFDTGSSNLPSQVALKTFPDSVTVSSTLRRFGDAFSFGMTQTINFQAMLRAPGIVDSNDHSGRTAEGHDVWHADGVADTEPIVLNEGEGIAVVKRAFGTARTHHWAVVVKVASTGATYRYAVIETGDPFCIGDASWSLMNGSGSGIVLHVYIVSTPDTGESNMPRYRLARIYGIAAGGTQVTPIVHDTATSVPEIAAYKGEFRPALNAQGIAMNYHNYQGTPITIVEQQRVGLIRNFMVGNVWTETAPPNYRCYMPDEIWPGERRTGQSSTLENDSLLLNPGEGLAVIGGIAGLIETSIGAYVNVEITGYVQTPQIQQPRARYVMGV